MRFSARYPVERAPVFESHRCPRLAGQIDHLLNARAGETAGDENTLQRPLSAESFNYRVDSTENGQIRLSRGLVLFFAFRWHAQAIAEAVGEVRQRHDQRQFDDFLGTEDFPGLIASIVLRSCRT